jgi:hypothetical protein
MRWPVLHEYPTSEENAAWIMKDPSSEELLPCKTGQATRTGEIRILQFLVFGKRMFGSERGMEEGSK